MLVANMNEFVSFVVIDDGANDKDAAEGAKLNEFVLLVVIEDRENDKDAAEGAN